MKFKFSLILVLLFSNLYLKAQDNIYSSSKASIEISYSSKFKKVNIENAPHMLLKLLSTNDKSYFAISFWEGIADDDANIWNDEVFNGFKNYDEKICKENLLSINKKCLVFQNKEIKVIESICNLPNKNPYTNKIEYVNMIFYRFLHKGNLILLTQCNHGKYSKSSSKGEQLLNKIKLK